jgi:very-short-patch-repair endonuclease
MLTFNHPVTKGIRKALRKQSTPQETILWSRLRRKTLGYRFRRQHAIRSYIVDFCCTKRKLIIEIDGWQHKENVEYDEKRTEYFKNFGYTVLRFWNNEINENMDGVMMRIEEHLK